MFEANLDWFMSSVFRIMFAKQSTRSLYKMMKFNDIFQHNHSFLYKRIDK